MKITEAPALAQLSPSASLRLPLSPACCPADRARLPARRPASFSHPDVRYLLCASARKRVTSAALLWTLAAAPRDPRRCGAVPEHFSLGLHGRAELRLPPDGAIGACSFSRPALARRADGRAERRRRAKSGGLLFARLRARSARPAPAMPGGAADDICCSPGGGLGSLSAPILVDAGPDRSATRPLPDARVPPARPRTGLTPAACFRSARIRHRRHLDPAPRTSTSDAPPHRRQPGSCPATNGSSAPESDDLQAGES